jgi:hypothetical protein
MSWDDEQIASWLIKLCALQPLFEVFLRLSSPYYLGADYMLRFMFKIHWSLIDMMKKQSQNFYAANTRLSK